MRGWSDDKINHVPQELRERAVRMVMEHVGSTRKWFAMGSIASKFGMRDDAGNAARLGAPG